MLSTWRAPTDSLAIPNLIVTSLLEDAQGRIWVGTLAQGLWLLNPRTEIIRKVVCQLVPGSGNHEPSPLLADLARSDSGSVWVVWTGAGLCRHDSGGRCTHGSGPDSAALQSVPSVNVSCVLEDSQGNLWVGTEDAGLGLRTAADPDFRVFTNDPGNDRSIADDQVNNVFQAPDGRIWISTYRGLSCWLPNQQEFRSYRPDPDGSLRLANYLLDMDVAEEGGFWIGSAVGLYHFDPVSTEFTLHRHEPSDPRSPVKGPVLSVLRDRSGVVWAGSWHAGLNKLDPASGEFKVDRADRYDPRSLDDDAVMAIVEDEEGTLWVGTGSMSSGGSPGGLNRRLRNVGGFEQLPLPREGPNSVRSVQSLCVGPDSTLWIGTERGLWQLTSSGERPVRVYGPTSDQPGVDGRSVRGLMVDREGDLWACVYGAGLYRIRPGTGSIRRYAHDPGDPRSISQNELIFAFQDSAGRIWIGADTRGLNLYRPETDDFHRFEDPQGLVSSVISMHEDSTGDLWVGSYGGLLRVDPDLERVEAFRKEHGLPHNQVGAILEDDQGHLWVSTGRGIARFDHQTGKVRAYDVQDGLPANEISFKGFRGRDGTLYFGGNHGLIHFHPRRIKEDTYQPNVVLTGLKIGEVPQRIGVSKVLEQGLPYTESLRLRHTQNDLSISFAALDFKYPDRNRYRYRLADYDRDWRDAGSQRSVTYTNLEPGDYRFIVQGSNSDGLWGEALASIALHISPPWWNTLWARGVYLLAALTLVLFIYRQIVQRERMQAALQLQRAEAEQLHELDRFKSRFFANISHEFRTPLTLIQAPLQRLRKDPSGGDRVLFEMMSRNAQRLGDLIEQLLDLSRLEAKRLPLRWQHGDWLGFLRTLLSSFDSLARSRQVSLVCELPEGAESAWHDPDVLEKLISNLLSNAFRYTPDGGEVRVRVSVLDDRANVKIPIVEPGEQDREPQTAVANHVRIEVANTGSYISPAERERIFERFHQVDGSARGGSGIGLALVKELLDWMHGTIEVDSDRTRGTRFAMTLPLYQDPPILGVEPLGDEELAAEEESNAVSLREMIGAAGESLASVRGTVTATSSEEKALVLVVEDHVELRTFLVSGLKASYRVLEARDGQEGLEIAQKEVPDLVLSDVMMPRLDGVELCERLKSDDRTSHVPIILLTAKTEAESRRAGLEVGADDYLGKPFDLEELEIRMTNLIEQRRKLAERYARRVAGLAPDAMPVTSADERFLARAREVVDEHLDDPQLDVDTLCREIGLSRAQLHRKLKALTGCSTKEFVRIHRLQRAASLLKGRFGNVTEVAYAVGFQSLSYFSRVFREQYGVAPSEFSDKG
jgi:signal transduction histidine kinase/ligand-binding sensor domain-containing protein/DNA-binding response OmpR family regulator